MSIKARPDEQLLWDAFGPDSEHETPRAAGRALGIPPRRVEYLCLKWTRQRRYNYGVSADLGWKEGRNDG